MIQEKQFRPIGASREISSNFRLISATNRNLEEMVKSGKFRGDLYFRIQSLVIKPPTLNGRKQDIAELTASHIIKRCQMQKKMTQVMDPGFLQCLQRYSWPGNVRELFNVLDSCLAKASECSLLASKHLPVHIRMESSGFDNASGDIGNGQSMPILPELKAYRKFIASRAEKDYLQNLINVVEFDIERACQISGLSRSRFYELMKKYQLPIPRNAIIPRQNQTDLAPPLYVDSPQTKASFDSQTPE